VWGAFGDPGHGGPAHEQAAQWQVAAADEAAAEQALLLRRATLAGRERFLPGKRRLGSAVNGRTYASQCLDLLLLVLTYNLMLD
jgi:hypothetical protein